MEKVTGDPLKTMAVSLMLLEGARTKHLSPTRVVAGLARIRRIPWLPLVAHHHEREVQVHRLKLGRGPRPSAIGSYILIPRRYVVPHSDDLITGGLVEDRRPINQVRFTESIPSVRIVTSETATDVVLDWTTSHQ